MKFIADFHIHSRYSIATSKDLDFENLRIAAQLKGIRVIGTGDITHPQWFAEAREKLLPAEEGLYRIKKDLAEACDSRVPGVCRAGVRFMLTAEISNIYKRDGKTRKNHNLIFLPDLESAQRLNQRLDRIGNITSDGRPILGLDARNLLEIVLESSEQAFLVPAHIWTPWFSVLGSKSGFDSISECFGDLRRYVFAVETGLSSDPEMNWRVSQLDGLTLISNSDAHSPMKLGREANIFDTDLSFSAIRSAMESGDPQRFLGTFEFYPEEGKYHLDGHRKCGIRLDPSETASAGGRCPVCEKPLTLGVLNRVETLSDRPHGAKPTKTHPFYSIVPLTDILSELLEVGPASKKVAAAYGRLTGSLGSELDILHVLSRERLDRSDIPLLGEAVERVREKNIRISPGFDGEFGKILIFDPDEKKRLMGQKCLFGPVASSLESSQWPSAKVKGHSIAIDSGKNNYPKKAEKRAVVDTGKGDAHGTPNSFPGHLNPEQLKAVRHPGGPLMIVAGPGTGKTLTLTHRIAHQIRSGRFSPEQILAVTFTNKAAVEMKNRLEKILGTVKRLPYIGTFHALSIHLLKPECGNESIVVIDEDHSRSLVGDAVSQLKSEGLDIGGSTRMHMDWISDVKTRMVDPGSTFAGEGSVVEKEAVSVYHTYQKILSLHRMVDYDDLISILVDRLENDESFRERCRNRFKSLFIDEYQDINLGQYRIMKALATPETEICVIGDPDQAIYGFRGADVRYFMQFKADFPQAHRVRLTRNYRSTETILKASGQVIEKKSLSESGYQLTSGIGGIGTIGMMEVETGRSEAVAVGKIIEKMVGGTGFSHIDFGRVDGIEEEPARNFSDFAVLFRTREPMNLFGEVFGKAGIPFQTVSRQSVLDRKVVGGIISLLKIIEGTGDFFDMERAAPLLGGGLNKNTLTRFKLWGYHIGQSLDHALSHVKRFPVADMKRSAQEALAALSKTVFQLKADIDADSPAERLKHLVERLCLSAAIEKDPSEKAAFEKMMDLAAATDSRSAFFSAIALNNDVDYFEARAEKVTMMTMHAAKGLEFPVVFIAGCEMDWMPFTGKDDSPSNVDEERRLFFVAMTRARSQLFLSCARKRKIYGRTVLREKSPFLLSISDRLIRQEDVGFDRKKKQKANQTQLELF